MLRTARAWSSLDWGVRCRSLASSRSPISAALAFRRSTSTSYHLQWLETVPAYNRPRQSLAEGARRAVNGGLRPHVRELQGDAEVGLADGPDHGLEVVLLLAGHADLVALDGRLDLHAGAFDELHELLGLVVRDADVHVHALPDGTLGRRLDRPLREGLQRDLAADGLVLQDLEGGL